MTSAVTIWIVQSMTSINIINGKKVAVGVWSLICQALPNKFRRWVDVRFTVTVLEKLYFPTVTGKWMFIQLPCKSAGKKAQSL